MVSLESARFTGSNPTFLTLWPLREWIIPQHNPLGHRPYGCKTCANVLAAVSTLTEYATFEGLGLSGLVLELRPPL